MPERHLAHLARASPGSGEARAEHLSRLRARTNRDVLRPRRIDAVARRRLALPRPRSKSRTRRHDRPAAVGAVADSRSAGYLGHRAVGMWRLRSFPAHSWRHGRPRPRRPVPRARPVVPPVCAALAVDRGAVPRRVDAGAGSRHRLRPRATRDRAGSHDLGIRRPDRTGTRPERSPDAGARRVRHRQSGHLPTVLHLRDAARMGDRVGVTMTWRLHVVHTTRFAYDSAAHASYNEARLTPPTLLSQVTLESRIEIEPPTSVYRYHDYWATHVSAFDLDDSHDELVVTATSTVETLDPEPRLEESVSWLTLQHPTTTDRFAEYLAPTTRTSVDDELVDEVRAFVNADSSELSPHETALRISSWIHDAVEYVPGATGVQTSAREAW